MENNDSIYEEMYGTMDSELSRIALENENMRTSAEQSIVTIRRYLKELKTMIITNDFVSVNDEVNFFKKVKPRFYCRLIYYHKILQIELKRPAAGRKAEIKYLRTEQVKMVYFFRKYGYLYQYCRSSADYLDSRFFTRGNSDLLPDLELYGIDTDPSFTTGYDFIVAKMGANDLLRTYLDNELFKLHPSKQSHPEQSASPILSWTASKASLIELVYGLQSTGVFNNGKAALNDVAMFMEAILQIKLGNYYRVFQEIRIRKKSRTQFLDEMKERLIQKMDYSDENPHVK